MRSTPTWIRRALLVVLVSIAGVVALQVFGTASGDGGVVPSIGGDTWPPVPVKDRPSH